MWNNHIIGYSEFLIGFTNMPIIGFGAAWGSWGREGIDEPILQQDPCGAKITLSATTIHMMDNEELVETLRWFAKHEPEITAIGNGSECQFDEQFCSDEDLRLVIHSALTSPATLKRAQDEWARRRGVPQIRTAIEKPKKKRISQHGYIYVLRAPAMDPALYKIGREKVLNSRVDSLGIKLPWELELIAHIESDDYIGLEAELHQRFADKRDKGEWFRLTEEDIEWIKNLDGCIETI